MNTKARKLRKDFLPCGDQRSIEENLNRLQDMYGYEETVTAEVVQLEETAEFVAGWYDATLSASIRPFDGKDVIVYIGDERFVTKCEYAGGTYRILLGGNFVDLSENATDIGMTTLIRTDKTEAATYTVKICTEEEQTTVHPMAEKFLPEGIGGGDVPQYKIKESWDNEGNSIYTCDLSFEDAYAMDTETLKKSILYVNTAPIIVQAVATLHLSEHIVLRFIVLSANSDMTITEIVHDFIWRADGITKVE